MKRSRSTIQKRCGFREPKTEGRKHRVDLDEAVRIDRRSVTLDAIEKRFAEIDETMS